MFKDILLGAIYIKFIHDNGVVRWCEVVVYLMSPGCPTDIDLQLGKACCPCSR